MPIKTPENCVKETVNHPCFLATLPAFELGNKSAAIEGERIKIIILSNINDIWTRLESLLEINLSGHTDGLTEASKLIDETFKEGKTQNEQQYRNALEYFQR